MSEELENFPTSESAKRQLSYVSSDFYKSSYVGKWLYQVMGLEFDDARRLAEELPDQFFPETATWGLMYHEIKWGLPVRGNLSYEERRRLIYLKRDFKAPMTPYRMERYLADATGFDVSIRDCNDSDGERFEHPNIFKVIFSGEGTVDTAFARQLLDKIKQSHTVYSLYDRIDIEFFEVIKSDVSIAIKGDFYPRHNIPYLMYDGTAMYNGRYRYNGYKTDALIDLYPIKLSMLADCRASPYMLPCMAVHDEAKQQAAGGDTRLACCTDAREEPQIRNRLTVKQESESFLPRYQIHLTIGKHLTRYDGTYRYDGTRKYDSEIIHEVI